MGYLILSTNPSRQAGRNQRGPSRTTGTSLGNRLSDTGPQQLRLVMRQRQRLRSLQCRVGGPLEGIGNGWLTDQPLLNPVEPKRDRGNTSYSHAGKADPILDHYAYKHFDERPFRRRPLPDANIGRLLAFQSWR